MKFSINQNHQESVSIIQDYGKTIRLALIKITKSPYQGKVGDTMLESLALIKITKSPYQEERKWIIK